MTDDPKLERPGFRWTPEEESYLRWAYSQGLSLEWTAKHLGRSVDATKAKAYRLGGLQHPRYGPGAGATGDLARRLADLQGLSPETEKVPEPLQDEALRRFVDDPAALFSWLGIDLFPYQEEGLSLIQGGDRTALVWGRQTGKDTLTALYGLWLALTAPGSIVICVSPSQRQSDLWMEKLRAYALSQAEVRDAVTDLSQSELALSNGSRVFSLPSGTGGGVTIRGFSRVSLLVFNEADLPRYRRAEDSETSALIKFYNARYEKKGFIWRVNKRTMELEAFPVFGPTILVTRRGFSDDALESRCLVILMQTTAREDIPLNLPPAFYEEAAVWRRKLLLFRLRHRLSFENDYEARIPGLQPRMQQILQPVVSLAKMISPSLVREIEGLAVDLNERVVEDRATSYEGQLVRAFARLKAARPGNVWRLPPEEVEAGQCRRCGKVRDLPWRDLNAVLFCDNCRADLEEGELVTATIIADVLNVGRKENRQVTPQAVGVRAKGLGLESRMKPDRSQRYLDAEPELLRHLLQKYAPREEREDLLAALGLADRSGQQSISQVVGPEPAPKEGQESETKTSMEAPSRAGS